MLPIRWWVASEWKTKYGTTANKPRSERWLTYRRPVHSQSYWITRSYFPIPWASTMFLLTSIKMSYIETLKVLAGFFLWSNVLSWPHRQSRKDIPLKDTLPTNVYIQLLFITWPSVDVILAELWSSLEKSSPQSHLIFNWVSWRSLWWQHWRTTCKGVAHTCTFLGHGCRNRIV